MPNIIRPELVLPQLDLKPGMFIADFGSGAGDFALFFAKRILPEGRVYAIDVQSSAIESVKSRAKLESIFNIEPLLRNLEAPGGSKLPDDFVDLVFIANILFQAPDKAVILKEARRILKPGGKVMIIEWKPEAAGLGPPKNFRIFPETISALAKNEGLSPAKEFDFITHYGIEFIK
ncbi:MAG: methyltransferase domain-containing protein [Parcubacteria group bacterium]|nr:methyltransferase domain-containing protein [Parcubacteria group bacterium]